MCRTVPSPIGIAFAFGPPTGCSHKHTRDISGPLLYPRSFSQPGRLPNGDCVSPSSLTDRDAIPEQPAPLSDSLHNAYSSSTSYKYGERHTFPSNATGDRHCIQFTHAFDNSIRIFDA